MKVRICLIVGSNGKSSAMVTEEADWGLMLDNIADWNGKDSVDPVSAKYFVDIEVPLPEVPIVEGKVIPAEAAE